MMTLRRLSFTLISLFLVGLLSACATPARMSAMIPERSAETTIAERSPLFSSIRLGSVIGGESTNPLWTSQVGNAEFRSAMRSALANHAMLANGLGKFELQIHLMGLSQPLLGLDMTVTSTAKYDLVNIQTRKSEFTETIVTPYTAKFGDAFIGTERLRLANEGSIREIIKSFIQRLIDRSQNLSMRQPRHASSS